MTCLLLAIQWGINTLGIAIVKCVAITNSWILTVHEIQLLCGFICISAHLVVSSFSLQLTVLLMSSLIVSRWEWKCAGVNCVLMPRRVRESNPSGRLYQLSIHDVLHAGRHILPSPPVRLLCSSFPLATLLYSTSTQPLESKCKVYKKDIRW